MIGSIIQGATSVASGIAGLVGARKDKLAAENAANQSWQRNYDAQKEFAQNSIQWRVQDAKNAGINPYAVVSGQSAGYTPQDTSYQTNYQQAASQAMNGLSDAMGQLNMAMAQEDLKGKKLDNDAKSVELINKMIEAKLGTTSATLQQPWFKTYTDPVKDADNHKIRTQLNGSQVFKSSADDIDPFNLQNIRDMMDALFTIDGYDAIKAANQGKGNVALHWSGNAYYPYGTSVAPANVRAADIQRKYGTLFGYGSLPFQHISDTLDKVKYDKNKIKRDFRKWLGR